MAETTVLNDLNQYLVFKLYKEEYALEIDKITSIIDNNLFITRVPTAPEHILGVINLRGDIIPVMDLRKKLGLPDDVENNKKKIIVTSYKDFSVGIMVDMVMDVIQLQEDCMESIDPYADHSLKEYFSAIAKHGQRLIITLKLESLVSE